MDEITGRRQHDSGRVDRLAHHLRAAQRKHLAFAIEYRQVGADRAQIGRPIILRHGQHKLVGADGVRRRQHRKGAALGVRRRAPAPV